MREEDKAAAVGSLMLFELLLADLRWHVNTRLGVYARVCICALNSVRRTKRPPALQAADRPPTAFFSPACSAKACAQGATGLADKGSRRGALLLNIFCISM